MSIKPVYADFIKQGLKTVELRRVAPKLCTNDIVVFYESAPIKKISFYAEVQEIHTLPKKDLWELAKDSAVISQDFFDSYFSDKDLGNGIQLKNVTILKTPQTINKLSNISVPQNYRYLSEEEFIMISNENI